MKKILVVRFSSIGDIVLTSPVVRCIKKQLPGTEIHYVTKPEYSSIVKPNPYIDKVIEWYDNDPEVLRVLKNENYDFICDLHHNLRSFKLKSGLQKPGKSFSKLNIQKWMLVNLKWNRMPKMHVVDRYISTVSHLGVSNDGMGLDFYIEGKDEIDTENFQPPWRNGYAGIIIGAKHFTKRMPPGQIKRMVKELNLPVVLLGGKEDKDMAESVRQSNPDLVLNACGIYNLGQSASLVRQARFIITHDTGLMHVAAAFRKKIISVWGNTVPAFGMYPYLPDGEGQSVIIENSNLGCRPCSKIGFDSCPKEHFKCMVDINISRMVSVAKEWWGNSQAGQP